MPDYWIDSDSFIQSKDKGYGFDIVPGFWEFLKQHIISGAIASPVKVYKELTEHSEDDLLRWVRLLKQDGLLFVDPSAPAQECMRKVTDYVNGKYQPPWATEFLDGADPWLISHANAHGGQIVTFEVSAPDSKTKIKIPDVAKKFDVKTLNVYEMVRALGMCLK
jgi:hypothetical protein